MSKRPQASRARRMNWIRLIASAAVALAAIRTLAAPENLDEMAARKARHASAVWPTNELQDPKSLVWQPETLCYFETDPACRGTEVWRMSNEPGRGGASEPGYCIYNQDIGTQVWSADGKRVALMASRRPDRLSPGMAKALAWYVCRTDGAFLRPWTGQSRYARNYFHWSPQQPDVMFEIGDRDRFYGSAGDPNTVYSSVAQDTSATSSPLFKVNLDTPDGQTTLPFFNKAISPDGRLGVIKCYIRDGAQQYLLPVRLVPKKGEQPGAMIRGKQFQCYTADRGYGPYGDLFVESVNHSGKEPFDVDLPNALASGASPPTSNSAGIPAPSASPSVSATAGGGPASARNAWVSRRGGSIAPGTYAVLYTAVSAAGETTPSPAATFTITTLGQIPRVVIPCPTDRGKTIGFNVYVGPAGHETRRVSVTKITCPDGTNYTGVIPYNAVPPSLTPHDTCFGGLDELCVLPAGMDPDNVNDTHYEWFLQKVTGSADDGGPKWTGDNAGNFGEIRPIDQAVTKPHNLTVPGCSPTNTNGVNPDVTTYWSHFHPDRWGRFAVFTNNGNNQGGTNYNGDGVWDYRASRWSPGYVSNNDNPVHRSWIGFTDWFASVSSDVQKPPTFVMLQRYDDKGSHRNVCESHAFAAGDVSKENYPYYTLSRPSQSPDGTKVAFHSSLLQSSDNYSDAYWAVAYHPYPPTNLSADPSPVGARISFLPPKYTNRRWINPGTGKIDEEHGEVLYAREVRRYHVWRASSDSGPWELIGTVDAAYANDPVTNTLEPVVNGRPVSEKNKLVYDDPTAKDGTWYYALTTEEHSGLESRNLSDVLKVTVAGGKLDSSTIAKPGGPPLEQKAGNTAAGQTGFWTKPPAAPKNLDVARAAAGQYRLNWTEPADEKVRYYNIYYAAGTAPAADQAHRIASIVARQAGGPFTYLDWLADPHADGHYAVTSVDRYGNESAPVTR